MIENWQTFWTAIEAIGTICGCCLSASSLILLIIAAIYGRKELLEMRNSTIATSYKAAVDILQAKDVRDARRFVFTNLWDKPFDEWSQDEILIAEKVCQTYDSVGIMVRYGILERELIVDSWGPSLRDYWPKLSPLVTYYRTKRNSPEIWDDFEWLAKEAEKYKKQ